jgi:hypothetical protein
LTVDRRLASARSLFRGRARRRRRARDACDQAGARPG